MADERACTGPTCTARVLWVHNVKTGARLILDVSPIPRGALRPGDVGVLGDRGKVLKGADLDDGWLTEEIARSCHPETTFHRTHWGSCADREHFAERQRARSGR